MTARIRAGDLNRLITIQQRSTSQDGFGQQVTTWSDVKKVYAFIEPLAGNERIAAMQVSTAVSHRITVRYDAIFADPRVVAAYRVAYNGRYFNIQAAMNLDEANRTIELLAAEGMNYG
ncbi:phage head closure protein [Cupriavidus necator]